MIFYFYLVSLFFTGDLLIYCILSFVCIVSYRRYLIVNFVYLDAHTFIVFEFDFDMFFLRIFVLYIHT